MLGGYERYSLRRKSRIKPVLRVLGVVALVMVLHSVVTSVLVFSLRVDSVSMEPRLKPGDRLIATPLAFGVPVRSLPPSVRGRGAPHRGDLVVLELPGSPPLSWLSGAAETVVRFVTFNQVSLDRGPARRPSARLSIKRVVGLPGDTVRMERFQALVRPGGHTGFQPESELVPGVATVDARPAKWEPGTPFSGDMEEMTLGADEYFVLGDNRAHASDSRSWGALPGSLIRGRPLFRYWPVTRVGRF
jgi:signal peptidase I